MRHSRFQDRDHYDRKSTPAAPFNNDPILGESPPFSPYPVDSTHDQGQIRASVVSKMSKISNNLRLGAQGYSSDGGSVFNNKLSKEYDSHSNEPPALAQRFPVVTGPVDK